jgi:hypothetical protein
MLGQALAADAGSPVQPTGPIANAACNSLPKSAALDALIVPAAGVQAHPTAQSSDPAPSGSGTASSGTVRPSNSSSGTSSTSDTASPSPSDTSASSPSPSDSPTSDPGPSSGTTSPSSTPTPTPSPTSATPTPTPTPSKSSPPPKPKPKTPQLCVRVQSFSSSSEVKPGTVANFAVWVWSKDAQSNGVTVAVHVGSATGVRKPAFTVCPQSSGTTCKMGNVPTGLADELQVAVKVGKQAVPGEQVKLTASATAAKSKSFSNSATDVVVAALQSTGTSPGAGELPPVSLPPIPGVGDSSGDPSGLFPTVGPTTPGSSSLGLPPVKPHKTVRVTEAAAAVPLDSRLIGGQLAGLAVLAGAVVIAIARLSLRTPKPAEDKGGEAKPPAE